MLQVLQQPGISFAELSGIRPSAPLSTAGPVIDEKKPETLHLGITHILATSQYGGR